MPADHISTLALSRVEASQYFHIGNSSERKAFFAFASLVWLYVALRACLVPWVHDESTSLYWFLERETFLPYVALWDAGNHFLSSAIGVLGHKLWGLSLFGSRVGSVLAFPLFAWAVYRIGLLLNDRLVRWCLWPALLLCPFLLDFFSLFRGYGLAMAFFLVAIDGVLRYQRHRKNTHLLQLLIGFALADFAVLSLVPLWAFVLGLVAADLLYRRLRTKRPILRSALLWFFFGLVPLGIGLLLSWEMRRRGLLYHGSLAGFIPVSLASLSQFVLGTASPVVLAGVALTTVAATAALLLPSAWRGPLLVLAALLWAEVCMRIGMALLLEVNYPEDRAALHFVPLSILLVAFAIDAIPQHFRVLRYSAVLLLVLPVRSVFTANVDHTQLWPEQSVPTRFLQRIASGPVRGGSPTIGAYHQLTMALPYAARIHGLRSNPPDVQGFPNTPTDYRIVDERFLNEALPGYRTVDHEPGPGLYLLERVDPLVTEEVQRWSFEFPKDTIEFMEVWRSDMPSVAQDLLFEVSALLDTDAAFLDLHLVMEQRAGDELLHYHTTRMAALSPSWHNDRLQLTIRMPAVPEANVRVIYFWDPERRGCSVSQGTLRMLRMINDPT